jgi:hypothetical protein
VFFASSIEGTEMALRFVGRFGALIGGGLIALAVSTPALEAQTPAARRNVPAPTDRVQDSITLTGCLLLGPYGDYTLSNTLAVSGSVMNAVAWKLEGSRELLVHVLEKVEITGTMMRTPPNPLRAVATAGSDRPTDLDRAIPYQLRVKTIRKIGGNC